MHEENEPAWYARLLAWWERGLFGSGVVVFAATCVWSDRLPLGAFFVGPAMTVAGVAMMARDRKRLIR